MSDTYKLKYSNDTLTCSYNAANIRKYKSFKWELTGRWNQGSGNTGATSTYMEWDELGIGFDNGEVCYGSDYWTFDNYTLNGTPWASELRMPPVLISGSWGTEYTKFDASDFTSLVLYFHTTSGEEILPTSIGLYSANNQNDFQSSTPLHFILYGLNEETNEYEQLIDINAADVNKGSTQLTTISSGFTYHYYEPVLMTSPISLYVGDYPTGTYTRTLYENTFSTGDGRFNDCIYNYDLLRITTMPQDPITNKLAAPNPPFYVEPEWLRNNTIHTQTFGYDNTATINTTGWFIWADARFSASPDGWNFITTRHGNNFRIGGTNWNTTGLPLNGGSASYLNYIWSVMRVDGIIYNGNRELLYSGSNATSAITLNKSITGNGYSVIQVKCGIQGADNMDGIYINELTPYRTTAIRDSLSFPMGGGGNWYNCMTICNWSNNFKTLTNTAAKSFVKSLTTTDAMTGNTAYSNQLKNSIYAVWGVK